MSKEWLLQSMAVVVEKEDIVNFGLQQDGPKCNTAEATLDVLRPVFENRIISRRSNVIRPPVILHRWAIIYGMPSKTILTLTCQRQLTLQRTIFVKPLVKYSCTQSIMCLKIGPIVKAIALPVAALFSIINRKDCICK